MGLKGVCSVEVRNADGSLAQKTTDENMVTNYIGNLINPDVNFFKNYFNTNVTNMNNGIFPLIDKVIGGVFLFGETLPEDADYKIPKASLIGHASSPYQYDIPSYGTLNKEESSVISNTNGKVIGYKYVWDFATDRANGTIKCISLTTGKSGTKGYKYPTDSSVLNACGYTITMPGEVSSNSSTYYVYHPLNVFSTVSKNYLFSNNGDVKYGENSFIQINLSNYPIIANIEKDIFVIVKDITTNSITLSKVTENNKIGLYDDRNDFKNRTIELEVNKIDFDEKIFTDSKLEDDKKREIQCKLYTDEKYIYISKALSKELRIYKIDPSTLSIVDMFSTEVNIDNIGSYQSTYGTFCVLYHNYYYTTVSRYEKVSGSSSSYYNTYLIKINKDYVEENEEICMLSSSSSSYYRYSLVSIYDDLLYVCDSYKTFILNDKGILNTFGSNCPIPIVSANLKFPYILARMRNDYYYNICLGVYNQGLITIDNLATPIIKNNTQTMKITYEITEE